MTCPVSIASLTKLSCEETIFANSQWPIDVEERLTIGYNGSDYLTSKSFSSSIMHALHCSVWRIERKSTVAHKRHRATCLPCNLFQIMNIHFRSKTLLPFEKETFWWRDIVLMVASISREAMWKIAILCYFLPIFTRPPRQCYKGPQITQGLPCWTSAGSRYLHFMSFCQCRTFMHFSTFDLIILPCLSESTFFFLIFDNWLSCSPTINNNASLCEMNEVLSVCVSQP